MGGGISRQSMGRPEGGSVEARHHSHCLPRCNQNDVIAMTTTITRHHIHCHRRCHFFHDCTDVSLQELKTGKKEKENWKKYQWINKGAGKRLEAGQTDKEMGGRGLSPPVNWWTGAWQGLESNRPHTRLHVTNQSLAHLGNF